MLESVEKIRSFELSSNLEFHFETLKPEEPIEAVRKCSFIDLLTTAQSFPEVPNFEMLLDSEEHFSMPKPLTQSPSDVSLTSLMDFMPVSKKSRNRKRPKAPKMVPIYKKPENRMVGTCTLEERRKKIEKYLEKRKRRRWTKRISYDCRKRVADARLRIKGRFVTKDQAIAILGIDHPKIQKLLQQEAEFS